MYAVAPPCNPGKDLVVMADVLLLAGFLWPDPKAKASGASESARDSNNFLAVELGNWQPIEPVTNLNKASYSIARYKSVTELKKNLFFFKKVFKFFTSLIVGSDNHLGKCRDDQDESLLTTLPRRQAL
jgi:hypothetical protein